jgi:hypothetical protein
MANQMKCFTNEEIKILSRSLWVKTVTPKLIRYTDAFKEEFLRQQKQGKSSRTIVENLGFDYNILGESRITGIRAICKDYALKKQSCNESSEIPVVEGSSTNAQLKRMQHKINFMEQQIEFIKKNILAERKARRS